VRPVSKHLRYLSYVVCHKWFVFVAGLKTGAPFWRLLIHDWSKFMPSEWRPYVLSFYGPGGYANRPPEVVEARLPGLLTLGQPHLEEHYRERFAAEVRA
jgi:hypothetical protein